jgi:hypothetical protein
MCLFSLTNFGLLLDIIGAILIYKFGLPSAETKTIHAISFSNPSEKEIKAARIAKRMSPVGLIVLIVGFVFQFLDGIFS